MAGDTTLTVVGNLTGDPELRFTPSGAAVANFTIASTPRSFDKASNEWKDGETLFMRCSVWRDAAEHVAESLTKGMRVVATGRLVMRQYETKEGEKRTSTELQVDEVGPSLRYATAKVSKTERSSGFGGGGQQQAGWDQPAQQPSQWGQQPAGDPWASNQPQNPQQGQSAPQTGPQGQRQGGWTAPPQQGGAQGGWSNAPSYDEPPF